MGRHRTTTRLEALVSPRVKQVWAQTVLLERARGRTVSQMLGAMLMRRRESLIRQYRAAGIDPATIIYPKGKRAPAAMPNLDRIDPFI